MSGFQTILSIRIVAVGPVLRRGQPIISARNIGHRQKLEVTVSQGNAPVPEYLVEQIVGEAVTTWRVVRAGTPEEAAREGTGCEVKARIAEHIWVRVTDEDLQEVYEFSLDQPHPIAQSATPAS